MDSEPKIGIELSAEQLKKYQLKFITKDELLLMINTYGCRGYWSVALCLSLDMEENLKNVRKGVNAIISIGKIGLINCRNGRIICDHSNHCATFRMETLGVDAFNMRRDKTSLTLMHERFMEQYMERLFYIREVVLKYDSNMDVVKCIAKYFFYRW